MDSCLLVGFNLYRLEEIPALVKSKYLKLVYDFHEAMGTLDLSDLNKDGFRCYLSHIFPKGWLDLN